MLAAAASDVAASRRAEGVWGEGGEGGVGGCYTAVHGTGTHGLRCVSHIFVLQPIS